MSSKLKTELLPHQLETVKFAVSKKFVGDFSEMGTGKSLSALGTIVQVNRKALVVCPPFLVNNWLNEISKHTTLKASPHFIKIDETADIHVIPYTQLAKAEALFELCDIVVADEAHYLKNLDAKRTMLFHNFLGKASPEYFMYLTGTPIKNRIPEIYSMLLLFSQGPNLPKIIDDYRSFYLFCCRFTNVKQTSFGTKFEGMKNVDELRKYVNPFVIRHGAEVLNLPGLSESSVVVSYGSNTELDNAFERFTDKGVGAEITVKRDSAVAKAKYTAQYVREIIESNSGPVVVFSDHKKPLEILELDLSDFRVGKITGETPSNSRQGLVEQLNRGQLDVLVCTIGAASSGFNMTGASTLVFNDHPWVPGDLEQAKKRIHRMGQDKPCRIVHIIGSEVDERILKTLSSKSRVINKMIKENN